MNEATLREALINTAKKLNQSGLSTGKSGNVSCRWQQGCLITPTGIAYEKLRASDIVYLSLQGKILAGTNQPSSEWPIHTAIYQQRPDAGAILHAHPRYSTALACSHREIPAFHYMVAIAGGNNIRCAPYATFGTQRLSAYCLEALNKRKACLMANHGLLTLSSDLDSVFQLALQVEDLAAQYCEVIKIGQAVLLDEQQMQDAIEQFDKGYGQPKKYN